MVHVMGSVLMHRALWRDMVGFVLDVSAHDWFGDTHESWRGETVKTVLLLASVLMSLALVTGCADRTEQRLRQVQNELEQVLRTALRDGDIRMQRAGDHLTVVIAERLLFDAGSHEIKPDGIDVLKQMEFSSRRLLSRKSEWLGTLTRPRSLTVPTSISRSWPYPKHVRLKRYVC